MQVHGIRKDFAHLFPTAIIINCKAAEFERVTIDAGKASVERNRVLAFLHHKAEQRIEVTGRGKSFRCHKLS